MLKLIVLLALVVSLSSLTFAFDTGYHFDLTRSVLTEHGFSDQAIKVAQVENWLTDYYASSPTMRSAARDDLEKLHFDNLFSSNETTRYWGRLMSNLREATRQAASDGDVIAMLSTIGISLHAAQDFYTHSNWVETHPRIPNGPYRTETFLATGPPRGVEIFTGKYPEDRKGAPAMALIHGDYESGLNKDSQIRPHWDEAYVFAYCGSHELLQLIEQWAEEVRPGFWKVVQRYSVAPDEVKDLEYDLRAVRNMSMWLNAKDEDGHWKGNHSGSARFFDTFSSKWVGKPSSVFVKQISDRKLQKRLTKNLYAEMSGPAIPKTALFALRRKAVLIRVTSISEQDEGRFEVGIDPGGDADFYAVFTVGRQDYTERVLQSKQSFVDPWFVIHFVDDSLIQLPISIAVWDEDDTDSGGNYKDDHVDISPLPNKRDLEFVLRLADSQLTRDVLGIHNSTETAFTVAGAKPDNKRAKLRSFVKSVRLQ